MRSSGEPLLEDRRRAAPHRGDERPLDLGPGGRAPGVKHPGGGMPAFASQGQITAGFAVEHRTRARSARRHDPGPSSTSTRTASTSHRPAPAANVSARCRSVESSSPPTAAAIPPWAQRVVDWARSALVSTPTRSPVGVARPDHRGQAGHTRSEDEHVELHWLAPPSAGRAPASARDGRAQRVVELLHGEVHHGVGGVHVDDGGLEARPTRPSRSPRR